MKISFEDAISYRIPAIVKHILVFENGESFPICPKCNITLEREYQRFCDRCGQHLDWSKYYKAAIIYWKPKL